MNKLLVSAALASTLVAGVAVAQNGPRGPMRADADHDGKISRAEMRAEADRRFDALDTNKDGFIDQAEFAAQRGPARGGPRGDMPPPPPAK